MDLGGDAKSTLVRPTFLHCRKSSDTGVSIFFEIFRDAASLLLFAWYSSSSSSSSSLHGLGVSPVPASNVVVSLSIFFLVYLCLIFRMVDIYMPVVECGCVPFFADVLSIYSVICFA
jgi:hypothetical protein